MSHLSFYVGFGDEYESGELNFLHITYKAQTNRLVGQHHIDTTTTNDMNVAQSQPGKQSTSSFQWQPPKPIADENTAAAAANPTDGAANAMAVDSKPDETYQDLLNRRNTFSAGEGHAKMHAAADERNQGGSKYNPCSNTGESMAPSLAILTVHPPQ